MGTRTIINGGRHMRFATLTLIISTLLVASAYAAGDRYIEGFVHVSDGLNREPATALEPGDMYIYRNLQVNGTATFTGAVTNEGVLTGDDVTAVDDVTAGDDVVSTDDTTVGDDLTVTDNTSTSTLTVSGVATVDDLSAGDDVTATDTVTGADVVSTDDTTVGDDLTVTDNTSTSTLTVSGVATADDLDVADDLTVGDAATITGDLAVTGNISQAGTTLNSTFAEIDAVASLVNGSRLMTKVLAITSTPTGAEQDTGFDLPVNAIVKRVYVLVTTAEATGGTKTLDVGILSTETSGDADGFVKALSVASTGMLIPKATLTTGGNETYFASTTVGELLATLVAGADVVEDVGTYYEFPYATSAATGRSVVYDAGSNDWAEFRGRIIIEYIEVN